VNAEPDLSIVSFLSTSVGVIISHTSFGNDDEHLFREKAVDFLEPPPLSVKLNDTLRRCVVRGSLMAGRLLVLSGNEQRRHSATACRLLTLDSELDELARLSDIMNLGAELSIVSFLSTSVGVIISHTSLDDDNDMRLLQGRATVFLTPAQMSVELLNVTLRCLVVRGSLTAGRLQLLVRSGNEARRSGDE
jgi:hypothetical protein